MPGKKMIAETLYSARCAAWVRRRRTPSFELQPRTSTTRAESESGELQSSKLGLTGAKKQSRHQSARKRNPESVPDGYEQGMSEARMRKAGNDVIRKRVVTEKCCRSLGPKPSNITLHQIGNKMPVGA
jgi:hypothetical protein